METVDGSGGQGWITGHTRDEHLPVLGSSVTRSPVRSVKAKLPWCLVLLPYLVSLPVTFFAPSPVQLGFHYFAIA